MSDVWISIINISDRRSQEDGCTCVDLPGRQNCVGFAIFVTIFGKEVCVFEIVPLGSKHLNPLMRAFERERGVCSRPRPHLLIAALTWKCSGSSRKVDFKERILQLELPRQPWAASCLGWSSSNFMLHMILACCSRPPGGAAHAFLNFHFWFFQPCIEPLNIKTWLCTDCNYRTLKSQIQVRPWILKSILGQFCWSASSRGKVTCCFSGTWKCAYYVRVRFFSLPCVVSSASFWFCQTVLQIRPPLVSLLSKMWFLWFTEAWGISQQPQNLFYGMETFFSLGYSCQDHLAALLSFPLASSGSSTCCFIKLALIGACGSTREKASA